METDHGETFFRKCALFFGDDVHVLVMTPRNHHVFHSTSRFVDTVGGRVDWVGGIGVCGKGFGINVLLGELTADDECVLVSVLVYFFREGLGDVPRQRPIGLQRRGKRGVFRGRGRGRRVASTITGSLDGGYERWLGCLRLVCHHV